MLVLCTASKIWEAILYYTVANGLSITYRSKLLLRYYLPKTSVGVWCTVLFRAPHASPRISLRISCIMRGILGIIHNGTHGIWCLPKSLIYWVMQGTCAGYVVGTSLCLVIHICFCGETVIYLVQYWRNITLLCTKIQRTEYFYISRKQCYTKERKEITRLKIAHYSTIQCSNY